MTAINPNEQWLDSGEYIPESALLGIVLDGIQPLPSAEDGATETDTTFL